MTLYGIALLAAGAAFVTSLLLPFIVRPLLVRLGIMDVPNERSSHERPVLRGLGLAVLIAIAIGGGTAILLEFTGPVQSTVPMVAVAVIGSVAAGLLGLSEDLTGLSVPVRSLTLLLIAAAVAGALILLMRSTATGPTLTSGMTWGLAGAPYWSLAVLAVYAVLFISSYINVANFMDGLNGISGFHGIIAGLTFAIVGWVWGTPWLLTVGLLLAAGYAGFLPWNLSKPGAFLGDVGSYLLGGAVAMTSFGALVSGVPFLATIGPMVLYFGDVGVTLVSRLRAGHHWDEPHKEHAYQRIQQLGYSHVQASAMNAGGTVLTSALGVMALTTNIVGTFTLFIAGFIVLAFYLMLPRILPSRTAATLK